MSEQTEITDTTFENTVYEDVRYYRTVHKAEHDLKFHVEGKSISRPDGYIPGFENARKHFGMTKEEFIMRLRKTYDNTTNEDLKNLTEEGILKRWAEWRFHYPPNDNYWGMIEADVPDAFRRGLEERCGHPITEDGD